MAANPFLWLPNPLLHHGRVGADLGFAQFVGLGVGRQCNLLIGERAAAMGCPGDVAESVLGHMIPGVAGVYNKHSYDEQRVEWLRRLSDRLEELAQR